MGSFLSHLILLFTILLGASGCLHSGDSSTDNILFEDGATCVFKGGDVCLQFFENISESNAESICLNEAFNYSPTVEYTLDGDQYLCSEENELGRCVTTVGEFVYYSGSTWNTASAQNDCIANQGGVYK